MGRCNNEKREIIVITVDETIFLSDFEEFQAVLVPLYNKRRDEKGLAPLDEDEITNLFLELRKKHGITA